MHIKTIIGIILIAVGIFTLAYRGITYTTQEKVAQLGPLEVTSQNEKRVPFPPILGGLCLVAGVILVAIDRNKKV